MTTGRDTVVSIAWELRPEEARLLGILTEMEVSVIDAGWEIIDTLRRLPREKVPVEVRGLLGDLEREERAYALRQSELREANPATPEPREAAQARLLH